MTVQQVKQRYGLIGNDAKFNASLEVAMRVAPTDLSVLITGESGVGKEAFSRIIHDLSARKHNEFIAVNCGAIPEGTIDSELFGHEKGAFTGATATRQGYFEFVNGGTIFLDEIGEMPVPTQARLLRVLESGEFIKVGSSKVQKTDVRVVAATNRKLLNAVNQGKFREDLYYRLNTVPVVVPPLRERMDDINMLFRKFSVDFADKYRIEPVKLNDDAKRLLLNYRWPGNIREIKNLAQQVSALADIKLIDAPTLLGFLPKNETAISRLPVLFEQAAQGASADGMSERDVMYKFLIDMKRDLGELKSFVVRMAESGMVPNNTDLRNNDLFKEVYADAPVTNYPQIPQKTSANYNTETPIILNEYETQPQAKFSNKYFNEPPAFEQHAVEVEESLSLVDMEKDYIIKALKKHKGKRKDAAAELGISERTLYRKIKEYKIEE